MNIARFSIRQSLFVNMLSVFILIMGIAAVLGLRREAFPNVSYDIAQVKTVYPGASSKEIEKLITIPIERELKEVDGVDQISSTSVEGFSYIVLKLDPDSGNKDKIVNDIQRAVDRVNDLPAGAEDPEVIDINTKQIPIIEISISGAMDESKLQDYAEGLEDIILDLDGAAAVTRRGFRDSQIWVEADPDRLSELHVSMKEIMDALGKRNISIPGGKIRFGGQEFSVRTTGEFDAAEEVGNVIIRANDQGNQLRVKDVASVRDSFKDEDVINKAFGSRSINLVVLKKEKADAIKLVDDIKGIVSGFTKDKSGLKVSLIDDLSFYIKRRLNILRNNGWVGMILVCLALFAFLSRGAAIMTAMGIPIAFMLTFIVMSFTGMTINLITMFGLVMILGLVVDDGIIISENVYRYIEKGLTPKEAAIKGTSEVIKPVTVTVLTTIVAFTPLLFMSGLIGKFIRGIPTVAIIALFASMLEAFFILPCHLADFAARRKSHSSDGQHKKRSAWFDKLLSGYSGILAAAVKRRYALAAALVSVLILSLLLAVFGMKFVLFPSRGIEQFYVRAEAPLGTSLYRTNELLAPLEEMLASLPKNELDAFTGEAGVMRLDRFAGPTSRFGSHLAQVTVYLTPERGRKRTASMIIDDLREKVKDIEGFDKIYFEREHSGPPVGKPVEVTVRGEKFDVLNGIADKIRWFLGGVKGVNDILSDYEWGKEEIRVIVDNDAAASTYLSVGDIASSVRNAFDGGIATTIKREKAEEEIAVLVRFPIERKDDISAFEKILIPNRFGNLIPLNKVARIEKEKSISYINHLDGKRAVTVTAEVDEKYTTSAVVNKKIYSKFKDISLENLGYTLKIGGEGEETKKSMRSLLKAFAMAFLLIFLILATNFRSLIQPLVIMLAIPFGLIGVVFGFFIHHEPLSFMAIMGIVGLNGVVVNDSIVLVDFINRLRAEGVDRRESILKAGAIRLRPVLLTTITTVGGLSTVAYGIGGRDPFLVPMALSIVWGLIFATALTLIALPCIYAIVDDVSLKFRHKSIFNPAKT